MKTIIRPAFQFISFFSLYFFVFLSIQLSPFAAEKSHILTVGNARFTVIAPECIRTEYSKDGKFIDAPSYFAVNRDAAFTEFNLSQDNGSTTIDTGKIKLTYTPDGKEFYAGNLKALIKKGDKLVEWNPEMKNENNLGGTIRTVDGVMGPVDLGEGLLSRNGWYLLDDSRRHLFTGDWVKYRPKEAGTDRYLFGYGDDYRAGLRAMAAIGGEVPMPRKYVLGAWYSRYWPYTSKDYRKIVKEYENHDFPLDVMVLDMDWHRQGWTGWSWNRELLPDPEKLLAWFHEQGLHVTLNVHPADGVGPHEDMYEAFMKDLGRDPSTKEWLPYDAGNKKYLDTLFKHTHVPHEEEGVDFWWLDWQQYPYTRSVPELTNLAWLNHYYYKHTGRSGLRGQSFSRWAGWGDHRHPIHFSGDADTGWPMLAFEVPFTSTAGNIGCFFWSHDIGGHMGGRNAESYTRWVQFGATSAALRSHSTRMPDQDRRPWKYPKWAEDSMRVAFHLRAEIFPYIYSSVRQTHRETIPLNRPMYIMHPEDEKAYRNPQQYYFGDHLLAAPVVSPGAGKKRVGLQTVWFPPDSGFWYNWFTGEKFTGGEYIVAADIDEFPLYVRGGLPIPLQPYTHRMATEPLDELVVRCYPGEEGKAGKFTLYEDDGVTTEHKNGKFAETELACKRLEYSTVVNIGPAKGSYNGQVAERAYVIELPFTLKAESAEVDGKRVEVEYDENEHVNRVRIPARPVTEGVEVKVRVEREDPKTFKKKAEFRRMKGVVENVAKGETIRDVIEKLHEKGAEKEIIDTLLAIGGLALYKKDESLYLYRKKKNVYFHALPGLIDGDTFKFRVEDRLGEQSTVVLSEERKASEIPIAVAASNLPEMPEKPAFGVRTNRVAKVEFGINGLPFAFEEITDSKKSRLRKWNVAGPFDFDRGTDIAKQQYGPEKGIVDLKAIYKGFHNQNVNWRKAKPGEDNIVDLQKHFYIEYDNMVAYAATYLYSGREQEITFRVNSDDSAELWLNGDKLLSKSKGRAIEQETDSVHGVLKPGANEVLLKVCQFNYDWRFKVSIETMHPVKESFKKK